MSTARCNQNGNVLVLFLIFVVFIMCTAAGVYFITKNLPREANNSPLGTSLFPSSPNLRPDSSNPSTTSDSYRSLISAAAQCRAITLTISYTGLPYPLVPEIFTSGQTKYEIKKSSDISNCTLIFSSPFSTLTLSEKGRKEALSNGVTDAQIETQLKTMNDSINSIVATQTETVCTGPSSIISNYISDTQKGNTQVTINGKTVTYTTSAGQNLVCTLVYPTQQ